MLNTTVLIIGGGLSGCRVLQLLSRHGIDCALVESRDRLGGRVLCAPVGDLASARNAAPARTPGPSTEVATAAVDLGPSWFWPGQPAIHALLDELNLQSAVYAQTADGNSVLEYAGGSITHQAGAASMAGSLRLDGGIQRLIHTLTTSAHPHPHDDPQPPATQAPATGRIHLSTHATSITATTTGLTVSLQRGGVAQDVSNCRCEHVVLALPPRLAASLQIDAVEFDRPARLQSVPTWMAAQAKIILTYPNPFWRHHGLSGDAFSQLGPMTEIHDATPRGSSVGALFGFVGVPATARSGQADALKQAAVQQVQRLFGEPAATPLEVLLQDWAEERLTATGKDISSPSGRPETGVLKEFSADNRIIWAGAETATGPHTTGLIEGAIVAANRAAGHIVKIRSTPAQ